MTVGIPGTGLGGLFYFLLVVMMPFREIVLTARRQSSVARWRRVGFHLAILALMLGVLWAEAWLLDRAFGAFRDRSSAAAAAHDPAREMFLEAGQFAAVASVIALAAVLGGAAALRFTPLAQSVRAPAARRATP